MELGSMADWAGAVASIASAGLSMAALWTAVVANRMSKEVKEDASKANEDSRAREELRDRRAMAGSLQAWWVIDRTEHEKGDEDHGGWGIMVANVGQSATVFHKIDVLSSGNSKGTTFHIEMLPPGYYFIKSRKDDERPWGLPVTVDSDKWDPITKSPRYAVKSISFSDQLSHRWRWSPSDGLTQVMGEHGSTVAR